MVTREYWGIFIYFYVGDIKILKKLHITYAVLLIGIQINVDNYEYFSIHDNIRKYPYQHGISDQHLIKLFKLQEYLNGKVNFA